MSAAARVWLQSRQRGAGLASRVLILRLHCSSMRAKMRKWQPVDRSSGRRGDAEKLPYPDGSFDVVLSQFGHMFAPRPDLALSEIRRVLRASGRIAFATWPPEHFVGRFFALVARHSPPPPAGAAPPPLWGVVPIVSERLSTGFEAPFFERGVMNVPALSLPHLWEYMSASIGPLQKIVERFASEPEKLNSIRREMFELAEPYYSGNIIHQSYLLTRAKAR